MKTRALETKLADLAEMKLTESSIKSCFWRKQRLLDLLPLEKEFRKVNMSFGTEVLILKDMLNYSIR